MLKTHVRPARDLRNHYAELAGIVKNHDQIVITNNGRGESVLIGIEEYAQYEEFLHHRYVEQALAQAKNQAEDPTTQWLNHETVWQQLQAKYAL